MRAFVFLLVLANLLFFVWAQGYFGAPSNPDAYRMQQQIKPEQLTVVGRGDSPVAAAETAPPPADEAAQQPEAETAETAPEKVEKSAEKTAEKPEKKEPNVCLSWGELPVTDADKLERLIVGKFSSLKLKRRNTAASGAYWVFVPPAANRQAAEAKAAELKELGAPEHFIVADAGPNQLAISLGVFSTQGAANERLEALRLKGVNGARTGERNVRPATSTVEARGPQGQAEALREAALAALPKNKPANCKTAAPR
ncbi:MAG: SPOR domain-containing protein [Betaproteobacteria bacterium]|nr:SPOR domain-containing protein [Betaproteobacteria bacterium]